MSGGVDSTTTALLLKEDYQVEGFFMRLAQNDFEQQLAGVQGIADKIGVRLHVVDLREEFQDKVLNYFSSTYLAGQTPNPCVICNLQIKFGLLLESMLTRGMDVIATGHYARVVEKQGQYLLQKGLDPTKDQSYFLSRLGQKQLSRIRFPLGERTKQSVYHQVKEFGFDDFEGKESQDVCFLSGGVADFLSTHGAPQQVPGEVVTRQGKVLGQHQGLHHYTVGQRRGLGIPAANPLYVLELNTVDNRLVVGENHELFHPAMEVSDLHWISGSAPDSAKSYTVRIRYTHRGVEAQLNYLEGQRALIRFAEPQRAITPGQFAVIYDGETVLGSGVIHRARGC